MRNDPSVTPQQQVQQALDTSTKAKDLLENAAFQEACNRLEQHYVDAWRNSMPHEQQAREDAWMMLRALGKLKDNLKVAAATGSVVSYNLRRTITEKES